MKATIMFLLLSIGFSAEAATFSAEATGNTGSHSYNKAYQAAMLEMVKGASYSLRAEEKLTLDVKDGLAKRSYEQKIKFLVPEVSVTGLKEKSNTTQLESGEFTSVVELEISNSDYEALKKRVKNKLFGQKVTASAKYKIKIDKEGELEQYKDDAKQAAEMIAFGRIAERFHRTSTVSKNIVEGDVGVSASAHSRLITYNNKVVSEKSYIEDGFVIAEVTVSAIVKD